MSERPVTDRKVKVLTDEEVSEICGEQSSCKTCPIFEACGPHGYCPVCGRAMAYVSVHDFNQGPIGDLGDAYNAKVFQLSNSLIICPHEDTHPGDDGDE